MAINVSQWGMGYSAIIGDRNMGIWKHCKTASLLTIFILGFIGSGILATPMYTITDLGTLGGNYSYAYGINYFGQVVGSSQIANGEYHAFLYSDGTMIDLGTLGGTESHAYSINDFGQVVGDSQIANGEYHAFLYSDGTMVDLGTLGYANGINNLGQVVGMSRKASGECHAFLYSDGMMVDFNNLVPKGWELSSAEYINDSGQIVGHGLINGNKHAFLATPIPGSTYIPSEPTEPIPEPSTILLLTTGIAGIAGYSFIRRRRS